MRTPHIYNRGNFYKETFQSGGGAIFQGKIRRRGGGKIGDFFGKVIAPLGKRILKKVKKPLMRAAVESGKHLIQGRKPSAVIKRMSVKHGPRLLKSAAEAVVERRAPRKRKKKKPIRGGGVRLNKKPSSKGKVIKKTTNIFNE